MQVVPWGRGAKSINVKMKKTVLEKRNTVKEKYLVGSTLTENIDIRCGTPKEKQPHQTIKPIRPEDIGQEHKTKP